MGKTTVVTNNDYTRSCIQPTNQRRCLKKKKRSEKLFRGKCDCSANGCGQVLKLQSVLTNQFAALLGRSCEGVAVLSASQRRVATSMDELEDSAFTPMPEVENLFFFFTVLSRQHNSNSDIKVETQNMMNWGICLTQSQNNWQIYHIMKLKYTIWNGFWKHSTTK